MSQYLKKRVPGKCIKLFWSFVTVYSPDGIEIACVNRKIDNLQRHALKISIYHRRPHPSSCSGQLVEEELNLHANLHSRRFCKSSPRSLGLICKSRLVC